MSSIIYLLIIRYKNWARDKVEKEFKDLSIKYLNSKDPEYRMELWERIKQIEMNLTKKTLGIERLIYNYIYYDLNNSERNQIEEVLKEIEERGSAVMNIYDHEKFIERVKKIVDTTLKNRAISSGSTDSVSRRVTSSFFKRGGVDLVAVGSLIALIGLFVGLYKRFHKKSRLLSAPSTREVASSPSTREKGRTEKNYLKINYK
jgi:hypothetical protein